MYTVQDIFDQAEQEEPRIKKPLLHAPMYFRSLFVSDLHLGTEGSRAEDFVDFLRHVRTQHLYLNGDIFDCWELRIWKFRELERFFKKGHSLKPDQNKQSHLTALRKLLKQVDRRTRVVYIPGNHDEIMRDYAKTPDEIKKDPKGSHYGNLLIMKEASHRTTDNRHYLVTHGDVFDLFIRHHRLTSIMGTHANEFLTKLSVTLDRWRQNARVNHLLEGLGLTSHWSLAEAIKRQADKSVCGQAYEKAVTSHLFRLNKKIFAERNKPASTEDTDFYDGIIGSHTHITKERVFTSPLDTKTHEPKGPPTVTYYNTGHWTGKGTTDESIAHLPCPPFSCTALVELESGELKRIRWIPEKGIQFLPSPV